MADLSFELKLQGSKEDLVDAVKVFLSFKDDITFNRPFLNDKVIDTEVSEEKLEDLLKDQNELTLNADGPFGSFYELEEIKVFEKFALLSKTLSFEGHIRGQYKYADVFLNAKYENETLHLSYCMLSEDQIMEDYEKAMRKRCSFTKFSKLLKIDKEEFDNECYSEFIQDAMALEGFPEMDYDTFMEYCDASRIDEDDYEEALEAFEEFELMTLEDYQDVMDEEKYTIHRLYNPKTGKYRSVKK